MALSPRRLYVCNNTFVFEEDGITQSVRRGAIVRAGHPIMEDREDMFSPIVVDYEVALEPEPEAVKLAEIRLPARAASRGTR